MADPPTLCIITRKTCERCGGGLKYCWHCNGDDPHTAPLYISADDSVRGWR